MRADGGRRHHRRDQVHRRHPRVEPLTADVGDGAGQQADGEELVGGVQRHAAGEHGRGPRYFGPSSSRQLPVVIVVSVGHADHRMSSTAVEIKQLLQAGGVHAAQFLLQVGDLVADPGRQLELQVARGGHHLRGQVLDQVGELGARHVRGVAALERRPR